ncbi:MAG: PQQ-dependent sugar dehydrogenase, partial [Thermoplasmata archaeon]
MANRSPFALLVVAIAVLIALGGLTYIWLTAQRPGGGPPGSAEVVLAPVRTGLPWPIALAFSPDGRVFYAERLSGNIRILGNATTPTSTFYTLPNTSTSGERGLLGLALDPEFSTNPYVYAYQTYNDAVTGTIYNRIVRIVANGSTGVSHSVILRMPPLTGATNHNGGVIGFGPDRKLYAVVGENAIPALAQDPMSPMGKILRMERNGSAPTDNPFFGNANRHNLTYT